MKKSFALILSLVISLSMVGCGLIDKTKDIMKDEIKEAVSEVSEQISEEMEKVYSELETVDKEEVIDDLKVGAEKVRESLEKTLNEVYEHAWVEHSEEEGFVINIVQDKFTEELEAKKAEGKTTETYAPWSANIEGFKGMVRNTKKLISKLGFDHTDISIIVWDSAEKNNKYLEIKNGDIIYDYMAK